MRQRAAGAHTPSDVEDFQMLARYWDGRADEVGRPTSNVASNHPALPPTDSAAAKLREGS